jgi:hypothetical protein
MAMIDAIQAAATFYGTTQTTDAASAATTAWIAVYVVSAVTLAGLVRRENTWIGIPDFVVVAAPTAVVSFAQSRATASYARSVAAMAGTRGWMYTLAFSAPRAGKIIGAATGLGLVHANHIDHGEYGAFPTVLIACCVAGAVAFAMSAGISRTQWARSFRASYE